MAERTSRIPGYLNLDAGWGGGASPATLIAVVVFLVPMHPADGENIVGYRCRYGTYRHGSRPGGGRRSLASEYPKSLCCLPWLRLQRGRARCPTIIPARSVWDHRTPGYAPTCNGAPPRFWWRCHFQDEINRITPVGVLSPLQSRLRETGRVDGDPRHGIAPA
jgi:hypothetical protein